MEEQKVWYCDKCTQYHYKRNMSNVPKICVFCKEDNDQSQEQLRNIELQLKNKNLTIQEELENIYLKQLKLEEDEKLRILKGELRIQKEQVKLNKEQSKLRKIKLKLEEDEKLKVLKEQLKFEKNERLKIKRRTILLNEWGKPETEKKIIKRDIYYKTKFGISLNDYNKILTSQNGCCDICKIHQSELVNTLCVDHNHETGEIRGLLCNNCNAALGFIKEKIEISLNLIEYIKKYQKESVKEVI